MALRDIGGINVGFGLFIALQAEDPQEISKQLIKLGEQVNKRVERLWAREFGTTAPSWTDWIKNSTSARARLQTSIIEGFEGNQTYLNRLKRVYIEAWKNRYKRIQSSYRASLGSFKTEKPYSDHYKYKRRNLGNSAKRGGPNPNKIRFTSPALMTGFLRKKIEEAFNKGGNQYIRVGNPVVQTAFQVDYSSFPKNYAAKFEMQDEV